MPPAYEAASAMLPTSSEPQYLFSLQNDPLLIDVCTFARALIADPARAVAVLVAWGQP